MKPQFSLYRRNGIYYCEDSKTGKQESLRTRDEAAAKAMLHSKNEAYRQPILNQSIAVVYLSATDPEAATRPWRFVMNEMTATKRDDTRHRYETAWADKAFDLIRDLPLLDTRADHFLKVLRTGTVSTNVYLRRLHNFALDLNWLPKSLMVAETMVPNAVVEAACDLARELIIADRTAAPAGEGLKYYNNAGVQTGYDKTDTRPIIPAVVQALLAKFGSLTKAKSGAVKLVRI